MGRIADYVATLSPAEREQFKDLIDECAAREADIHANAARAQAALLALVEQHTRLSGRIQELEAVGARLQQRVGELYLRAVPRPSTLH
jgi:hypothetical protein